MRKQIQALGRLKTGQMNKTESAYCQHLEQRKRAGEVPPNSACLKTAHLLKR